VKGSPIGQSGGNRSRNWTGEAGMYWDGLQHHVSPARVDMGDFCTRNDLELDLFRYLRTRFGHVSYERIVSGPGLVNVFHFLRTAGAEGEPQWLIDEMSQFDPAAAFRCRRAGKCPLCEQAVDLFVSIYGAEAGNLALKILAIGGIYLGAALPRNCCRNLRGRCSCKRSSARDECNRCWRASR